MADQRHLFIRIPAFADGALIPIQFTQSAPGAAPGEGTSPAIEWGDAPEGTLSFFLHVHDLDFVRDKTLDDQPHWLVWNIPPTSTGLPEGVSRGETLADGSWQISATGPVYRGPGAPAAGPLHHYVFELFALDIKLSQPPAGDAFQTRAKLLPVIDGHILAKVVYAGRFKRPA